MMRFPRIPALLCILTLVSHPGCTVKENRDLCPALLVLESRPLETAALLHLGTATGARTDTLPSGLTEYQAFVDRGPVSVLVRAPADLPFAAGPELRIPEGEECPEIRLFAREYDIRGEMRRDSVRLYKSYCLLDLQVVSRDGTVPYSFAAVGGWCGFDAAGQVLAGTFRHRVRPDAEGHGCLRIPRQGDDSLRLELTAEDGIVRSFSLGEYLRESGYDWTAEDLADAGILIDYAQTSITFVIGSWSTTFTYEIVI